MKVARHFPRSQLAHLWLDLKIRWSITRILRRKDGNIYQALFRFATDIETRYCHDKNFENANGFWRRSTGEGLIKEITERLQLDFVRKELPLSKAIVVAGIQSRFDRDGTDSKLLRRILRQIDKGEFRNLSADLLYELCIILLVCNRWSPLAKVAQYAVACEHDPVQRVYYCCDLWVLSAYRAMGPVFNKGVNPSGQPEELKSVIAQCVVRLGRNSRNAHVYHAILACLDGRYHDAIEMFLLSQEQPGHQIMFFRNSEMIMGLDEFRALPGKSSPRSYGRRIPTYRHRGHTSCHLVSCDERYFDAFFEVLLETFGKTNPGKVIHLHAVNFTPRAEDLDSFERQYKVLINYTVDQTPHATKSQDLLRGYCAGARYMFLREYLREYQTIVITDIDGVVDYAHDDLVADHANNTHLKTNLLSEQKYRPVLWSAIWAGTFKTSVSLENLDFAECIAAYLKVQFQKAYRQNSKSFFSDQVALMLAYLAFNQECHFVEIDPIYRQPGTNTHFNSIEQKRSKQRAA